MTKGFKILLAASLLTNFGDNLIGPFYAVFVQKIGGSILDIGYTMAFFSLASGLLIIAIGKISDYLNKELITILGYFMFALGSLGYLLITNPLQLFMLQIVFAVGMACLSAPLSALFANYVQKNKEGMQWGLEGGGAHITVGLAVIIGTLIVNYLGFASLFIIMFTLQMVAVIIQTNLFLINYKNKDKHL